MPSRQSSHCTISARCDAAVMDLLLFFFLIGAYADTVQGDKKSLVRICIKVFQGISAIGSAHHLNSEAVNLPLFA